MFQHLPQNLIFDILAYFLPECKKSPLSGFPWFLGHICSRWRIIFLSSPQFWSTFTIRLSQQSLPERVETIIRIFTERSRHHPLTFEFSAPSGTSRWDQQSQLLFYDRMLEILVSKSAYWREARLHLSSRYLETLYKAKDRLPQLVSLEIFVFLANSNPIPAHFADLFINAPCLSRIYVYNFSAWNLNLTSITTIKIHSLAYARPEKFHQMLQQTKALEKLELEEPFNTPEALEHIKPVTLPCLKILRSNYTAFLPFIQAPALEYLWIHLNESRLQYDFDLNTEESLRRHAAAFFGSIQHLKYMVFVSRKFMKDGPVLMLNLPKVDHLCLVVDTLEMLRFPESCWSTRHFRQISVTFILANVTSVASEMARWNRNRQADDAPRATFPRLEKVSLDVSSEELEHPDIVNLKKHFEEQDIQLLLSQHSFVDIRLRYYLDVFEI